MAPLQELPVHETPSHHKSVAHAAGVQRAQAVPVATTPAACGNETPAAMTAVGCSVRAACGREAGQGAKGKGWRGGARGRQGQWPQRFLSLL